MDYEKAYKEALERAKAGKPLDEVFQELKESKDERIRKAIISALNGNGQATAILKNKGIYWGDAIAYLEKQKEQKPSPSIYWHAIKKGDTLPCRAYLWTPEYEKYYDCFEGRLIPNVENVTAGADMWYLPVDDIQNLPREGIDELPKEQKPALRLVGDGLISDPNSHFELEGEQKPTEWSEEDDRNLSFMIECMKGCSNGEKLSFPRSTALKYVEWLKSLRPQPHWKPSEEQMKALYTAAREAPIIKENGNYLYDLYDDLKKL